MKSSSALASLRRQCLITGGPCVISERKLAGTSGLTGEAAGGRCRTTTTGPKRSGRFPESAARRLKDQARVAGLDPASPGSVAFPLLAVRLLVAVAVLKCDHRDPGLSARSLVFYDSYKKNCTSTERVLPGAGPRTLSRADRLPFVLSSPASAPPGCTSPMRIGALIQAAMGVSMGPIVILCPFLPPTRGLCVVGSCRWGGSPGAVRPFTSFTSST